MKISGIFTVAQQKVLADLHERDSEERRAGKREPMSLKAVGPDVARLLCLLILREGARIIVEFGTSHGYSTIHLAAAGLLHRVTLVESDGTELVAPLPDRVDLVLVDYGIPAFARRLPGFAKRLRPAV